MRSKVLGLIAALALLTACETAPAGGGAGSGGCGAGGAGGASTSTAPGPNQATLNAQAGDLVFFDLDKSTLKAEGRTTLEKQAAFLKQFPQVTVTIEGHCDERGTREYNLALGERRANAAKDYLVALGIAAGRVKTISYGKERPVAMGSNEEAWAQNRRAVTVVTSTPAS